jgi:uncharacterized iron-regulated protein
MIARFTLGLCLALGGCARQQSLNGVGFDWEGRPEPELEPAAKAPAPRRDVAPDTVTNAALPFYGIRAGDGQALSSHELLAELSEHDVICVGERHNDAHAHWAELAIATDLADRAEQSGRELAIGFEMFDRKDQPLLDQWLLRKLDTAGLLARSNWDEDWGYPVGFYRPLLDLGRNRQVALLALNAPRELTRQVAREGLEGLGEADRKQLPELDLEQAEHRAVFDRVMAHHPHTGSDPEDQYAAQVVWDETMADSAARWLRARRPARQVLIVAGEMHCRSLAIPGRIERRTPARTAALIPIVERPNKDPKRALDGFDYAFVMTEE